MACGLYTGNQILIDAAAEEIRTETSADNEFAGFRREFFRLRGLAAYISND
jgi:hypothetical protein